MDNGQGPTPNRPDQPTRRALLGALALAAVAGPAAAGRRSEAPPAPVLSSNEAYALLQAVHDEAWWSQIQSAFTLDRTVINLNNGGCCPTPRVVHEAFKRYLDWSNQGPPFYMWQGLEPGVESVRRELALEAGCDPEELAITRNASEALQIVQLGLDLQRGDEILTTEQDYPRMLTTWAQRVQRDGLVLRRLAFPAPCSHEAFVQLVLGAMGPKTKVLHLSHIVNITGQILPIQRLCAEARARGIFTLVDGAHAFAQWPFSITELGCDAYGTSLHKWLLAPVGTGFLYVRRDQIGRIWPLQPAPLKMREDIRKFEEIGTHPAANHNAVAEALVFHRGVGARLKAARLRHLRARWTDALRDLPRVRLLTSDDATLSCGIGTVGLEGADIPAVVSALWTRWRIVATPIVFAPSDPADPEAAPGPVQFAGVRVTPNIYTTLDEIDRFAEAFRVLATA